MKGGTGQADPGEDLSDDFPEGRNFCNCANSFHLLEKEGPGQVTASVTGDICMDGTQTQLYLAQALTGVNFVEFIFFSQEIFKFS
jgi:hypothetical protein